MYEKGGEGHMAARGRGNGMHVAYHSDRQSSQEIFEQIWLHMNHNGTG